MTDKKAKAADEPDKETLAAEHKAATDLVNELEADLVEAKAEAAKTGDAVAAADAPAPVIGPRVKLEETGAIIAVEDGQQRERRLLIDGRNYEHVDEVVDQGETVWVYRRM